MSTAKISTQTPSIFTTKKILVKSHYQHVENSKMCILGLISNKKQKHGTKTKQLAQPNLWSGKQKRVNLMATHKSLYLLEKRSGKINSHPIFHYGLSTETANDSGGRFTALL